MNYLTLATVPVMRTRHELGGNVAVRFGTLNYSMIIKSLDATSLYKLLGTSAARKRAPEIIPTVLGVVA